MVLPADDLKLLRTTLSRELSRDVMLLACQDAGLDMTLVALDGAPQMQWNIVLQAAASQGYARLQALLEACAGFGETERLSAVFTPILERHRPGQQPPVPRPPDRLPQSPADVRTAVPMAPVSVGAQGAGPGPLRIPLEFVRAREIHDAHGHALEGSWYSRVLAPLRFSQPFELDSGRIRALWRGFQDARLDDGRLLELGRELRRLLGPADLSPLEDKIADALQQGRSVQLVFRSAARELYDVPWEALHLTGHAGPLAAGACLMTYQLPEVPTRSSLQPLRPEEVRALFAWSEAGGRVPHLQHLERLVDACQAGGVQFDPSEDVLPEATLPTLVRKLTAARATRPVTVLHVLCHGGALRPDPGDAMTGLVWNAGDGDQRAVLSGLDFAVQLEPFASMLRLVVVCACNAGGKLSPESHLDSVAQGLHSAGIPAVIASRIPLSKVGSRLLTDELYRALLQDRVPVEAAFKAARQTLFLQRWDIRGRDDAPPGLDFAGLMLYSRVDGGQTPLFSR